MSKFQEQLKALKGKRVLVTGHTGFKGSWLCHWLLQLGAQVTGYALPPERPEDHFSVTRLDQALTHVIGDIRDGQKLLQVFAQAQPEVVFHLAAQPLVRYSYDQPKETFDVNVGGSVNLLEAVRATPSVRSLVYVTSDKCYKNKEWIWGYRENDEMGGHDPYSASKGAAELVFSSYCDSFFTAMPGLGVATVRAGNVIGGGDWAKDRIIPDCIRALSQNQKIGIRNPVSTRPWQHVLEPLSGYLLLAARLLDDPKGLSGAWNFGPDHGSMKTVKDLVEELLKTWGQGGFQLEIDPKARHEATLLHLSCEKAKSQLHWSPRWEFAQTVAQTAGWYKKVLSGQEALAVTQSQINLYQEG